MAAFFGAAESVEKLKLKYEAPENLKTNWDDSLLYLAVINGHIKTTKVLVGFNYNPNARNMFGLTPLHCAAGFGYLDIVKILVELTKNPIVRCNRGWTPIHVSSHN